LRRLEDHLNVRVVLRDNTLTVMGEVLSDVSQGAEIIEDLLEQVRQGKLIEEEDVLQALEVGEHKERKRELTMKSKHALLLERKTVVPKTAGQAAYLEVLQRFDVVFSIGPAGTGKTYLAVAKALSMLRQHKVDRVLLVRPAVEAGENLGFLPGDIKEKVDPYLRPLWDALRDMMGFERIRKFLESGVIEIAPLAYMRGRTLDSSFVIMDEAQNTTLGQMKMFLTRLGSNSKAVITGDITQIDLPRSDRSGLIQVQDILSTVDGVAFVYLTDRDVVRHRLVRAIIKAFDSFDAGNNEIGEEEQS
jgi:phosphate starvation-inducible PhoH-like protein